MLTDTETPSLKKPEPATPPQPYVKPVVERIPLSEARLGTGLDAPDLSTLSS